MSKPRIRPYVWMISLVSVIVPTRFRKGWLQEWKAELEERENLLSKWRKLDFGARFELFRRSLGSFRDAMWLQPRRLEDQMFQDIHFGLRMLVRKPGFTIIAVIALALGIGANTAVFSIINGVLLKPLAYREPDRLVRVWESFGTFDKGSVSYLNFKDWVGQTQSFEQLAAFRGASFNFSPGGEAELIDGLRVSSDFLRVLGVSPARGRDFASDEDRTGADPVVLISDSFWQRRFGNDPSVVGKSITLSDSDYTVIGILPSDFRFVRDADIYAPIGADNDISLTMRSFHPGIQVVGRLKPGVSLEQGHADLATVAARLSTQYPDSNGGHSVYVDTLYNSVVGDVRTLLLVLLSAVALVLLIACANVANLMLVRAAARQKEIAVRCALGASRGRIARQLITESVMLALIGGGLGLSLALWGTRFALKALPDVLPRATEVSVDWRVLLFTIGASLLTGIVFGLAPGIQASRPELSGTLKEGSRGSTGSRHRVRSVLVISEVSLTLILLVGAGLLIRSFVSLSKVNPGFEAHNILSFDVNLSPVTYSTGASVRNFYLRFLDRVEQIPGIDSAAITTLVPLSGDDNEVPFFVNGRPAPPLSELPFAMNYITTPNYLRAMRIPLIRGRYFDLHDTFAAPHVAVIDSNMARDYFAGEDPIGRHVTIQGGKDISIEVEVVGIVGHIKQENLNTESGSSVEEQLYIPLDQIPEEFLAQLGSGLKVLTRTNGEPASFTPAIRNAMAEIAPNQPITNVRSMEKVVGDSTSNRRFVLILIGVFAALALVLATTGIYGVMSYSVSQRTHELGIRMALGARRGQMMLMVLGNGLRLVLIGILIGGAGALILTRFISSFLFGVSPADPLTFLAISLLLIGVALFATWFPARRALRIDPMDALRYE